MLTSMESQIRHVHVCSNGFAVEKYLKKIAKLNEIIRKITTKLMCESKCELRN